MIGYSPSFACLRTGFGRLGLSSTRVASWNAAGRLPGGKPDEGEPHVRFGKGKQETGPELPRLFPTSQAGGSVWKRVGSKPSVESPFGGAIERSVTRVKPAASLDIEGEPSRAAHGEGHGSGEDPESAAVKDSPA